MFNNGNVRSRGRADVWRRLFFSIPVCVSLVSGCAAARGRSDSSDTDKQKQPADEKPQDNFFSGG